MNEFTHCLFLVNLLDGRSTRGLEKKKKKMRLPQSCHETRDTTDRFAIVLARA